MWDWIVDAVSSLFGGGGVDAATAAGDAATYGGGIADVASTAAPAADIGSTTANAAGTAGGMGVGNYLGDLWGGAVNYAKENPRAVVTGAGLLGSALASGLSEPQQMPQMPGMTFPQLPSPDAAPARQMRAKPLPGTNASPIFDKDKPQLDRPSPGSQGLDVEDEMRRRASGMGVGV